MTNRRTLTGVKYTLPSDNEGARQRRMRSPLRRPCFGAQSVKAERAQYDGHFFGTRDNQQNLLRSGAFYRILATIPRTATVITMR